MARYFMGDTRLGWLERMMMTPPKPMSRCIPSQQKKPQNLNRLNKPRACTYKARGGQI